MCKYYSYEKITEHMTVFTSLVQEYVYLIEGENGAILVDAGSGVGHLKKMVEQLTDKPVMLILTHGHMDHAMGAVEFDDVYMNPKDMDVYREHCGGDSLKEIKEYLQVRLGVAELPFAPEDYVIPGLVRFQELKDEDRFDLGGVHVKVFEAPGHTPGSMVVLIEEEKILILGDACNTATFVFDKYSSYIEDYAKAMKVLYEKTKGLYEHVYLSHRQMEVPIDVFTDVIDVCEDIMNGRTDDVPYNSHKFQALYAKAADKNARRLDGKWGNIVYSKDRIWNPSNVRTY